MQEKIYKLYCVVAQRKIHLKANNFEKMYLSTPITHECHHHHHSKTFKNYFSRVLQIPFYPSALS